MYVFIALPRKILKNKLLTHLFSLSRKTNTQAGLRQGLFSEEGTRAFEKAKI
jgi:hypothetical protein